MNEIKLYYGMKLIISVNPIEYDFMGMFGISSSSSPKIETEFIVDKYWEDDVDPMRYKVKCIPVDKSGRFGVKNYYSCDLCSLINSGSVKIVE